jgi:hypothetical protein
MKTFSPDTMSAGSALRADSMTSLESDQRKTRPVFVMGCHRSGTNLLYDTLLSAGGFADYRGYLPVHKMLIPRFGDFTKLNNRQRAMQAWVRSKGFRRSGLDAEQLMVKVLDECRTGGDFVRIVMNEIARNQDAARWAVYDPDNLLHIPSIRADIPEALFIHIIRDGRDVALSLSKMGGFKPLFWHREAKGLLPTAVYWEWMVRKGRQYGLRVPADYIEVRYEELVSEPRATLKALGTFLNHDLNYDRIQNASLGRLREPNSSFSRADNDCGPVNRWRTKLSSHEVDAIEAMVGEYLEELGYPRSAPGAARKSGLQEKVARTFYFNLLDAKLWLKTRTPAGRLASLKTLELSDSTEPMEAE